MSNYHIWAETVFTTTNHPIELINALNAATIEIRNLLVKMNRHLYTIFHAKNKHFCTFGANNKLHFFFN